MWNTAWCIAISGSVCLSACSYISKTTHPNLMKFCIRDTCDHSWSVRVQYAMHFRFCGWSRFHTILAISIQAPFTAANSYKFPESECRTGVWHWRHIQANKNVLFCSYAGPATCYSSAARFWFHFVFPTFLLPNFRSTGAKCQHLWRWHIIAVDIWCHRKIHVGTGKCN